jgi:hypothetical protein
MSTPEPSRARVFVPPLGARVGRFAIALLALLAAIRTLGFWLAGIWDWLFVSGWSAFILAVLFAHTIPDRLEHALARLAHRGVLAVTPDHLDRFCKDQEERIVRRWAPGFGFAVALGIAAAFAFAYGRELVFVMPLLFLEMVGGYIAGCYLGRVACYGSLGSALESRGLPLRVMAGHLDGVGGLKPIGEFYFYQAMVVAIPAVFLAMWLFLFTLPHFQARYYHWQKPYAGLLALAIMFEVLAFVLPLLWFHRAMVRQKTDLLREADQLSPKIAEIQRKLGEGQPPEQAAALEKTLVQMTAYVETIDKLPVWPVDPYTKRRFALNNLMLFFPVVSQLTGLSQVWADFLKAIFTTAAG